MLQKYDSIIATFFHNCKENTPNRNQTTQLWKSRVSFLSHSDKKTPQSDEFRSAAFYFYVLPGWAARLYVNQYGGRAEKSARPPYYLFGFSRFRLGGRGAVVRYRDKALRKFVLAAAAYIKIADDREGQRADKVDEQILHRVQQTNVEIPAQTQCGLGTVGLNNDDIGDILQHNGGVAARGVQHDGANRVDDGVLLHIEEEQLVHRTLKKFLDDAGGHRKAERHDGQIQRRQVEPRLAVAVQNVQQGKADGRAQKAVQRVQHRVPVGEGDVVRADLAHDFRCINEQQDDDLQRVRQGDVQLFFQDAGHHEQDKRQHAEKNVFKVAVENLCQHDQHNRDAQQDIHHRDGASFAPDGFPFFEFRVIHGFSFSIVQRKVLGVQLGQHLTAGYTHQGVIAEFAAAVIGGDNTLVPTQDHFGVGGGGAVQAIGTGRGNVRAVVTLFKH